MKSTKNCSDGQFLFFNRNFIAIIWKMVLSASYLVLFKRLLACFRRLTTSWPYVPIVLPHLVKSPYKTILIRASNLCSSMVALMKLAMGYWLSLWKMVYYGYNNWPVKREPWFVWVEQVARCFVTASILLPFTFSWKCIFPFLFYRRFCSRSRW